MSETGEGGRRAERIGVLLVHGVGDIEPGAVLDAAAGALAAQPNQPWAFPEVTETWRRRDADGAAYPVHSRRGRCPDGRSAVFRELHWSDMKSMDARKATPAFLFLGALLGAHRVIGALLAGRGDPVASALRAALLAAAAVLRGPIVGLNLALFVMLLAIKYCAVVQGALGAPMPGVYFVIGGLAVSAGAGLFLASGLFWRAAFFRIAGRWTAALSALGLAAAGAQAAFGAGGIAGFSEYAFFTQGWALQIGLWGLFTVLAMAAALLLLLVLATGFGRGAGRRRRGAALAVTILFLQGFIWGAAMRLFWLSVGSDLAATIDQGGAPAFGGGEVVRTLQFTLILNLLVLASGLIVLALVGAARAALARLLPARWVAAGRLSPRVVFSPLACAAILLLGVAAALGAAVLTLTQNGLAREVAVYAPALIAMLYEEAAPWLDRAVFEFVASTLVALSPAALLLFGRVLAQGGFLLMDLTDYQPDGRGAGAGAMREKIAARFEAAAADFTETERIDLLVIVAHSQGGVIVFDALRRRMMQGGAAAAPVRLITMGAPLASIYAHYFEEYADLPQQAAALRGRLLSWVNLTRLGDPIGAPIGLGVQGPAEERALPPGGHAGYWRESAFGAALLEALGAPIGGAAHHPAGRGQAG